MSGLVVELLPAIKLADAVHSSSVSLARFTRDRGAENVRPLWATPGDFHAASTCVFPVA